MFSRLRPTSRLITDLYVRNPVSQRSRHTALFTCLSSNESTLLYSNSPLLSPNKSLHVTWRLLAEDSTSVQKAVDTEDILVKSEETFAALLRHSPFMQIGNPVGKVNTFLGPVLDTDMGSSIILLCCILFIFICCPVFRRSLVRSTM